MILFCGSPSESPLALAIQAAEERGVEHLVLNQSQFQLYDIRLDLNAPGISGSLWVDERECSLARVRGVYARLAELQDVHVPTPRRIASSISDGATKATFVHDALNAWFQCTACRVANRGVRSCTNISRPFLLRCIHRAGFLVPPTLVTTDPSEVLAFERRHSRVVYKTASSAHSIVHELTPETARDLDEIRHLPTLFQAYVPGVDVRVHIVGNEVFATRVANEAVDCHALGILRDDADVTMEPITLPDEIEVRCRRLSRDLDLSFCGIDLRVTPEGEYYGLDVDASPTFSAYQEGSGQPIAHALVGYLAGVQ